MTRTLRTLFAPALFAPALLAPTLLACAACSPGGNGPATQSTFAPHPVSGLPVIALTVTHHGQRHVFRVEVAKSAAEQAKGLMFRTTMGADEGMIFPMNPPRQASFWMHNTVLPLDIIFVDPSGHITNIAADARPYDETPLPSVGLAKGVLELVGGRAAQLGIEPGDKVEW